MAEQIITLGIGGTPANLTPFITTGLEVGEVVVVVVLTDKICLFTLEVAGPVATTLKVADVIEFSLSVECN